MSDGTVGRLTLKLLMLTPNLPKSQVPYMFVGVGEVSQLLILSAKMPQTQISYVQRGMG